MGFNEKSWKHWIVEVELVELQYLDQTDVYV